MTVGANPKSEALADTYRDLQQQTVRWVVPGMVLAGLITLISFPDIDDTIWSSVVGVGFIAVGVFAWFLDRWRYVAAAIVLVVGSLVLVFLMLMWGAFAPAAMLLVVPVGLATLLLGTLPGMALAGLVSLSLVAHWPKLPDGVIPLQGVVIVVVWATVAMIWLTLRPLLSATASAWSSYERSLMLLEQSRDTQMRLEQTLEDYATANAQLIQLNRQVQGLRQVAEEARRVKQDFVANVSHELRTPLNMIVGFSEMILNAPQMYGNHIPPALLADLKIIHRNSQHLSSLVNDVLDLSQVEAGRVALTKERISIEEVIDAAVTAVRPLFDSKGLYLRTDLAADLPDVLCDRTRIREVLLNLLSNAGRFTEEGGVVVRGIRQGHSLVISVEDTGPGIPEESYDRMFQPFEQLDNSIRREYGGSGLGLAISKEFVELHGGTMGLESKMGEGTVIYFTLPLEVSQPTYSEATRWIQPDWEFRQRTRPSRISPPSLHPRFIVLERGDILERLLRRYWDDAEVTGVETIDQAVTALSERTVHAFLINSESIPETIAQLRDMPAPAYELPIFVCTVPDIAEAASALGASDYLIKPVSRDALLGALQQLAPGGRRVLIVDDEPEALRLFWRILASAERGYEVVTASNGRQALDAMRQNPPDALLLDLVMPDMDGFKLLEAKQADPQLRDIPSVVLSARDPTGQPIVSESLLIAHGDGLSVGKLLASIESVYKIIAPVALPSREEPDPASSGADAG